MTLREIELWSETLEADVQVLSDGRTCWVNAPSGECIGRWSLIGVDVHHTVEEQKRTDSQCLDCRVGGSWPSFLESMKQHYGIELPRNLIRRKAL